MRACRRPCVDAAEQRLREAFDRLLAEPAAEEGPDRLFRRSFARDERLQRDPRASERREQSSAEAHAW